MSLVERQSLDLRLQEDADSYYQAALFSFIDGIQSVRRGFYSFATVKLYYSTFYSLRARLAIAGHCIFYHGTKGRLISTDAFSSVTNAKSGSTHKTVFTKFASVFPNDSFLTQDISAGNPLEWLASKREDANYGQGRFSEPTAPTHLMFAATTAVRLMLASYSADRVYIHDPDHAIVAFPFRLLVDLRARLALLGLTPLSLSESTFIATHSQDETGVIGTLSALIQS